MSGPDDSLLDRPLVGAAEVAGIEDAVAALLGTTADVLLMQAEAVLALEACARGLGGAGVRALNVVTGPYGALFGDWLRSAGSVVTTLQAPFDGVVSIDQVEQALSQPFDLVAVVHAEAATGGANPIEQIAAAVYRHGALLVVDAVASIGAHQVSPDGWPADVVVIGGQKALAGPAGVSALSISQRAWHAMEHNPTAPRRSILSLLDLRDGWLLGGRTNLPGTPSSLETAALAQALARVSSEGLDQVIGRHRASAAATRAGIRALGLQPWIATDAAAAAVVTTVAVPDGQSATALLAAARRAGSRSLGAAPGSLSTVALRLNHTGRAADLGRVCAELAALSTGLGRPAAPAVDAARRAWR